jgi:hypothetical protein
LCCASFQGLKVPSGRTSIGWPASWSCLFAI